MDLNGVCTYGDDVVCPFPFRKNLSHLQRMGDKGSPEILFCPSWLPSQRLSLVDQLSVLLVSIESSLLINLWYSSIMKSPSFYHLLQRLQKCIQL
jgi:hypothetical protein